MTVDWNQIVAELNDDPATLFRQIALALPLEEFESEVVHHAIDDIEICIGPCAEYH